MRFSTKVFWTIFGVSTILGSGLIWVSQEIFARRAEADFVARYQTLSDVVARSLVQLETSTSALMRSAAEVVALKAKSNEPLSREELIRLRDRLGVTHIFLVNTQGAFVRSTNEDPKLIPNLYSFCDKYRDLIHANGPTFISTPIVPAYPEPVPFKFLVMPNANRTQLIEIGVGADYIAKTLSDALKRDRNLTSLKLLTPDGVSLGEYHANGMNFDRKEKVPLNNLSGVEKIKDGYSLFSKVEAPQGEQYECEVSQHARDGKYYYLIETSISNRELAAALASVKSAFFWIQVGLIFLAALAARVLSMRVSGRVSQLVNQLREIDQLRPDRRRIGITGKDEVSYLSQTVDQLLDRLEGAQQALLTSQKKVAVSQIAAEVSHNIKSPIASLEGLIDKLALLPDSDQGIFRKALREIRALSEKLRKQATRSTEAQQKSEVAEADFGLPAPVRPNSRLAVTDLGCLLTQVVQSKRLEMDRVIDLRLLDSSGRVPYGIFSKIDPNEFSSLISNLINNAVEAIDGTSGRVSILASASETSVEITIRDNGKGMPTEVLAKLGREQVTYGKPHGSGIGLLHATRNIQSWQGRISVKNGEEGGTEVSISIPSAMPPAWFVPELRINQKTLIIVDDSPSIHELWRGRAELALIPEVLNFSGGREFLEWWEPLEAARKQSCLILMDLVFPGESLDGLQVIERVRAENPQVPTFLVTSSYDEESVVQRANWLNAGIIPKPTIRAVPIVIQEQAGLSRSFNIQFEAVEGIGRT